MITSEYNDYINLTDYDCDYNYEYNVYQTKGMWYFIFIHSDT